MFGRGSAEKPRDPKAPRPARRWRRVLVLVLTLGLGYAIGLAQPLVLRPPLVLGQDAISDADSSATRVRLDDVEGRVLVVEPARDAGTSLVIIYPGGLVRPQAYEWLARRLAGLGHLVVIPELPLDLAVTDSDRAAGLIAHYGSSRRVVLIGHSLGGAMGAQWAAGQPTALAGLVLLGAYPPAGSDLSKAGWPSLVVAAEHDKLATPDELRAGMAQLAPTSNLVVLNGAVHAFFGRYGPQAGDGLPTVSRSVAEEQIVAVISTYLGQVLGG